MSKKIPALFKYFPEIWLAAIWIVVQISLYTSYGIRYGGDAGRYFYAANCLLRGEMPAGDAPLYMGYNLFVTFFIWSGIGEAKIILAQVLLTAVAGYCLYKLAYMLYDRRSALLAVLFYILYAEIHTWNFYILTDSIFVSLIIISLFLIARSRGWAKTIMAAIAVGLTVTVRPNGMIILLAVIPYILYLLYKAKKIKVLVFVSIIVGALLGFGVMKLLGSMLSRYGQLIPHSYAEGTIIWGYQELTLKMPGTLPPALSSIKNPFIHILIFIKEKPFYFFKLIIMRLGFLFIHARPFYSHFHNCFSILTLLPLYLLALRGIFSPSKNKAIKLLLISLCFFQSIFVALTYADWDGRFLLVILPIVFVFSAHGVCETKIGKKLIAWHNTLY